MDNLQAHEASSGSRLQQQRLSDDQIIRSQELGLSRLVSTGAIADARGALIVSTNIAMLGALVSAFSGGPPARAETMVWVVLIVTAPLCFASAGRGIVC